MSMATTSSKPTKGDSEREEVRSRLVAREIKQNGADRYFAGTPPLALVVKVCDDAGL